MSLDKVNQVSAGTPPAQVMETRTDCSVLSAILCLKDMFYCFVSFSLSLSVSLFLSTDAEFHRMRNSISNACSQINSQSMLILIIIFL